MTDSLQIGIDPLGVSLWNTAVHPLPAAWLGAHASRPRSQPVLVALSSPASPPDFAPSGSTAVIIDDQLFFIFTMAIKTHAQALFLYYLLRNIGTCLASFNHVTAHSLQTGSHLLTPPVTVQSTCFLLKWHREIPAGWTSQTRLAEVRCDSGEVFFKAS